MPILFFKALNIDISNELIDEKLIGKVLFYKKELDSCQVKELLMNGNLEFIDLKIGISDIIVLPNNQLLCSNPDNKFLTLYDENLKLIRIIDKINEEAFKPQGIAINEDYDNLYITDQENHQIIRTDLYFNKIQSVGSYGMGDGNFKFPFGICFKNDKVYCSDYLNKKIQTFNSNLEFFESVILDYVPMVMKAKNSMMMVQSHYNKFLYIYELPVFNLLHTVEIFHWPFFYRISLIDSCFYLFNYKSRSVAFFDENGFFKEEIDLNNKYPKIDGTLGHVAMIKFNKFLLIISSSGKQLIKLSKN